MSGCKSVAELRQHHLLVAWGTVWDAQEKHIGFGVGETRVWVCLTGVEEQLYERFCPCCRTSWSDTFYDPVKHKDGSLFAAGTESAWANTYF